MQTPDRAIFDTVYDRLPADQLPWHYDDPPAELLSFINTIEPCKAVELGCGLGIQCIALARRGFDVTGLDCSTVAIERAAATARAAEQMVDFRVADLVAPLVGFDTDFQLAWDWEVLHHIFPAQRPQFADNVASLLNPGGFYYSVSFSLSDPFAKGQAIVRTPLGTELYFSTQQEVADTFSSQFDIMSLESRAIRGKRADHLANIAVMKKR